jgi:hypothetical protein
MKRVISYASRGLNKAEKNYPPHKREFLALKWSICDKFKDYLYGQRFSGWTCLIFLFDYMDSHYSNLKVSFFTFLY